MEVIVACTALDEDGRGVGEAGGLEVHAAGLLPGETGTVGIEHRSPHAPRAWGVLVALTSDPAEERVPPACPGHLRCGGCILQHLAYPAQLSEKRARVERAFAPYRELADVDIADPVASPRELHYRNKAKYVIAARPGGGLLAGSYKPGTHEIVDMAGCQVPEPPIDEVVRAALHACEHERLPPYDEAARSGELRYLVARANADGAVLVVVVTRTAGPLPALRRAARALRETRPEVAGVIAHVNATTGGAIFEGGSGGEDHLLDGASALADTVGDLTLELSARAFFQVNRLQAARLYDEAARGAAGRRAIDLYTGAGGIALTLGRRGARVVGIELSPDAVRDATRTAQKLGLAATVRFEAADAAVGLPAAARWLGGVDAVVVNPPRKGLGGAVRAAIAELAPPRLVYVSCGPASLGADLAALVGRGYRVEGVLPFDLMPGTPHIETLVTLRRA